VILRTCCNTCLNGFTVRIDPGDGPLLAQLADEDGLCACPRQCGGKVLVTKDASLTTIASILKSVSLSAKEFFSAVHGGGMPDEVPNSEQLVASLLIANKVLAVETEEADGRVYLHEIHLENGTKLHLGAGGRGAQVWKVTKAVKVPA
jgi:hypothetical protein